MHMDGSFGSWGRMTGVMDRCVRVVRLLLADQLLTPMFMMKARQAYLIILLSLVVSASSAYLLRSPS